MKQKLGPALWPLIALYDSKGPKVCHLTEYALALSIFLPVKASCQKSEMGL